MKRNTRAGTLADPASGEEAFDKRFPRADRAVVPEVDETDADLDEEDEEEVEPREPELQEIAADEAESGQSPDDALGLYLRQMGAIPLLNRTNEIEVAQRLERSRNRFRMATLRCRFILHKAVALFEKVNAGQTPLDPNVDIVSTAGLKRDQILARLPGHLRTLRSLLKRDDDEFYRGLLFD